jgi:hypothetical protein
MSISTAKGYMKFCINFTPILSGKVYEWFDGLTWDEEKS